MAARFCANCGQPVVAGSAFCPSCGAPVRGNAPLPAAASPPATLAAGPGPGGSYPGLIGFNQGPSAASRDADLRALSRVSWAAVIGLLAAVVSLVSLFGHSEQTLISINTNGGTTALFLDASTLYLLAATAGVGVVLAILELILYRTAFHALAPRDSRFSTPSKLTLLAVVALVLIAFVGLALLVVLYQAIACAGAGNAITSACLSFTAAGGLILLLLLGGLLAVIGYIGLLIGIWRLGTRYGDSMFKVATILLIIPVLSIVGLILILVAARSARSTITGGTTSATFG
ncbi:MAG: DUF973 family protein [Thermoplasmata archaeon]